MKNIFETNPTANDTMWEIEPLFHSTRLFGAVRVMFSADYDKDGNPVPRTINGKPNPAVDRSFTVQGDGVIMKDGELKIKASGAIMSHGKVLDADSPRKAFTPEEFARFAESWARRSL